MKVAPLIIAGSLFQTFASAGLLRRAWGSPDQQLTDAKYAIEDLGGQLIECQKGRDSSPGHSEAVNETVIADLYGEIEKLGKQIADTHAQSDDDDNDTITQTVQISGLAVCGKLAQELQQCKEQFNGIAGRVAASEEGTNEALENLQQCKEDVRSLDQALRHTKSQLTENSQDASKAREHQDQIKTLYQTLQSTQSQLAKAADDAKDCAGELENTARDQNGTAMRLQERVDFYKQQFDVCTQNFTICQTALEPVTPIKSCYFKVADVDVRETDGQCSATIKTGRIMDDGTCKMTSYDFFGNSVNDLAQFSPWTKEGTEDFTMSPVSAPPQRPSGGLKVHKGVRFTL